MAENKELNQEKQCDIQVVIPRFSVSLVYLQQEGNKQNIALRSLITDANNKDEALGIAITHFDDEMTNYNLSNKVVIELK